MTRGFRLLLLTTAAALAVLPAEAALGRVRKASRRQAARRLPRRPLPPPSVVVPVGADSRDLAVSAAARAGLGAVPGAVVAMDPYTGRVLAVVNPGLAVSTAYQPCSVFKVVVAIAGLSEGAIAPDTTYDCNGGCWLWPGHGPVDLRRALAGSCNPFFEWVGERLGYETVERYASLLGLGSATGINLGPESPGRLPAFVPPRLVGHVSSHAKGVATSAVQLAVVLSATLNGGIIYQPQLGAAQGFVPRERWRLPAGTVVGGLGEGFLGAVNEGSASTAFDPDVAVAGKTGTCAGLGWFASYAPAERPELVIVVLVRHGSGHLASTVAGRIYQYLYRPDPGLSTMAGGR